METHLKYSEYFISIVSLPGGSNFLSTDKPTVCLLANYKTINGSFGVENQKYLGLMSQGTVLILYVVPSFIIIIMCPMTTLTT